jgi:hypothetical protein
MHSIHNSTVRPQDDRICQLDRLHETHMVGDVTHGQGLRPIGGVQLPDRAQGHLLNGEITGQLDQPINIPGIDATISWPEVVLLAHPAI